MACANTVAALQRDFIHFDSSISGLNGCVYASGATGNIVTEDIVHGFEEMAVFNGVELAQIIAFAKEVQRILDKTNNNGSCMFGTQP
ncbi:hypothetical protein BA724_15240 [Domibacillus iocasae]|uniref:Pyruvate carboxyltransferase domain-containing protein n=1 Tax=Domibacillus iocasae TaxID=1714016 RepID=A0A1E7DTF7_9BACI|nr:hypothetical protein BA724_15240 [Domibacillus iocasae]